MATITHKTPFNVAFEFDIDDSMPEEDRKELEKIMRESMAYIGLNLKEAFLDRLANNKQLHPIISKINKWDIKVKASKTKSEV